MCDAGLPGDRETGSDRGTQMGSDWGAEEEVRYESDGGRMGLDTGQMEVE